MQRDKTKSNENRDEHEAERRCSLATTMDSAMRYGSCVPVTTIGIAQFSDQRRVGDKSADSSANAAGNVTGVPLNAHLGWHSPDDLVPKHSGCSFSPLLARQIANDVRPDPSQER